MNLLAVVWVEITSATPEDLLNIVNSKGVEISSIEYIDALHIRASISAKSLPTLEKIARSRGDELKLLGRKGVQYTLKRALRRPALIIGLFIWFVLLLYLPTRVLFVEVTGNHQTTAQQIISNAEVCGIYFGASRREVRSERIKNSLLGMMPQLQWVGVNTYGCRAVISVVERTVPESENKVDQIRSVIALRDGIITSVTVTKGNALCKVGQAVRKGQLLVSPYTDCGLSVKAETADAEVFGQTNRILTAETPLKIYKREKITVKKTSYSLRIGNKIINFSKDSGILGGTCAKMYEEKVICLPGGFALPIAVIRQTSVYTQTKEATLSGEAASEWMQLGLLRYLNTQMTSGKVLQTMHIFEESADCRSLHGNYVCEELIGEYHTEEMLPDDG